MFKVLLIIILVVCTLSCDNSSDKVVSKSKMEQVLYDYHLAQALIATLPEEERYKAEMYIESVYEKNGITREEFDSSMVYYNRHADELKDIYNNLHDRFAVINEKLQLQTGNNEMMTFSENGDTTNIWGGKKLIVLRNKEILNKEIFTIKADTSFHKGDRFIFKANTRFVNTEKRSRNYRLTMCLNVNYSDGKTISEYQHIMNSSAKQITLNTDRTKEIEQVNGFFYYEGLYDERNFIIVDNIELIKIHTDNKIVIPPVTSDKTDSITSAVSIQETKLQNTIVDNSQTKSIKQLNIERAEDNKKVEIKSAPDRIRKNTGPIIRRTITNQSTKN